MKIGFLRLLLPLALVAACSSCQKKKIPTAEYAQEMRDFVISLSSYAKSIQSDFIIIPQNGAKLMSINEKEITEADLDYLSAIDGQGQEDLFFGYNSDDQASDSEFQNEMIPFLDLGKANGVQILVTDYCSSAGNIAASKMKNDDKGYLSFAATERDLTVIPSTAINNENSDDVSTLMEAKNFLYLINPGGYQYKSDFISTLDATNYDAFIIDLFDYDNAVLTISDILTLQTKPGGAKRLVIAYMSIGEAEDYRYYWKKDWEKRKTKPEWLYKENSRWKGNYKVFYWMKEWQALIYGSPEAYLNKVIMAGFDGVYLDIVDAFEYYDEIKNN